MEKKITYVEALVKAIEVVEDVEVRNRLIDLKNAKEKEAANKKSKKAVDNSEYQRKVVEILSDGVSRTPSEMVSLLNVINTQKVAGICTPMIKAGTLVKEQKGKSVKYRLA